MVVGFNEHIPKFSSSLLHLIIIYNVRSLSNENKASADNVAYVECYNFIRRRKSSNKIIRLADLLRLNFCELLDGYGTAYSVTMLQYSVLVLFLIYSSPSEGQPRSGQSEISTSLNEFAFHLYKEIGSSVQGQNVFLSPFSISTAISMVYLGARGRTRSQMATALRLNAYDAMPNVSNAVVGEMLKTLMENVEQSNNNKTVLKVANRLFGEKTFAFEKKYLRQVKSYFNSSLKSLNFTGDQAGSRRHINSWVKKQTFRKIVDLLPDGMITSDTKLILVNAVYFKGLWKEPFIRGLTRTKTFNVSRQETTSVPMMSMPYEWLKYHRSSELECDVVELPYVGDRCSMLVFVPREIDGLTKVESRLNATSFNTILRSLSSRAVSLDLPKFTMKRKVELISYLTKMGIKDVFEAGNADLTGMGKSEPLVLDKAVHETFVGVNEEGTEAAGATGIKAMPTSMTLPVTADRPFLFLIVEKTTKIVLFLGRLADPRL